MRTLFLILLALPVTGRADFDSCRKAFSKLLVGAPSVEDRRWLEMADPFLAKNGASFRALGVEVKSPGTNTLRVRIPGQNYDEVIESGSAYTLTAYHHLNPTEIADAFAQLPQVERAVARVRPVSSEDRYFMLSELLADAESLSAIADLQKLTSSVGPLRGAGKKLVTTDKTTENLLAVLDEPNARAELYMREHLETMQLKLLSNYSNKQWLKFVATIVQDIRSERLARLRLAKELDRLLQAGDAEIIEVFPTGSAFNDKFFPKADQARAFSEGLPVFKIRVLPGKELSLSRSWGGKSGELSNWLLPEETKFIPPALMREKFATPSVNTHENYSRFAFGPGETFYLGGINPLRGPKDETDLVLGDFNYGVGGRGGSIQFWRDPSLPRLRPEQVVEKHARIVTSESLWKLRKILADAKSVSSVEERYASLLKQIEERFLEPDIDIDIDAAIRDVPESFYRAFQHDLKVIRETAVARAAALGGKVSQGLLDRADTAERLVEKRFLAWHSKAGVGKPYDPDADKKIPLGAIFESDRISGFEVTN